MREHNRSFGKALRVIVVFLSAVVTLIGVMREAGIHAQGTPRPSTMRKKREPLRTSKLPQYLKQTDWVAVRAARARRPNAQRVLRQFPLTEINLTANTSQSDETDVAWSPSGPGSSGTSIAFASNRRTNPSAGVNDDFYHLYTMNRDGTNVVQRTRNADFNPALLGQREPSWNPQAPNRIIFVAPDPYLPPPSPPYTPNPAVTQTDLFVLDIVRPIVFGSNPFRIPLPVGGIKRNPRYLADGLTIVFASNTDITAPNEANTPIPAGRFSIFSCNENGLAANRTRITGVAPDSGTGNDTFPAGSSGALTPFVLFTSDRPGVGVGLRHIWGVRLTASKLAQSNPVQVTGTATLTTNSGAPSEEFHPDWHDPLPAIRANTFYFASTRNDSNGCATTHASIWQMDMGGAQAFTETASTATPQLVSIQGPLPPAGVVPYNPAVAQCADNIRPSASHSINIVGGTDQVALVSNRQASSFDIWRSTTVDITPPLLTPVSIAGSAYPVMAPGVPNDAPGTLVASGSPTPRTPRGGLVNQLTIACVLTERESGLSQVRAIFRDLDYSKTDTANFDGCLPSALGFGGSPFGILERLDDFGGGVLPPATERQAPTIGTPVPLAFFDNGPPSAGGSELQPGAVAGDGVFFCVAQNVNLTAQGLPQGRDYSIDIEATDVAGNPFTYDNIWGMSTRTIAPTSQILLINDHMQGQAFLQRLEDAFPNEVFAAMPCETYWTSNPGGGPALGAFADSIADLGISSIGPAGPVTDTSYDHWRILARGPVPIDVLAAYAPSRELQFDPVSTLPLATRPTLNFLVSEKCVFWGSPFSGNLIAGPGTIDDPGAQQTIRSFVSLGGRILFSGRDIGFALTQNGAQPNNDFFSNVLRATFVSDENATPSPSAGKDVIAGADRIFYDGPWGNAGGSHYSFDLFPLDDLSATLQLAIDNYPPRGRFCYTANPPAPRTAGDAWRGDLMNSAVTTPNLLMGEMLFIDSIRPRGSVQSLTYGAGSNGEGAAVRFQDPTNSSIVAYLAFGLEQVHREYRAAAPPRPDRCLNMRAKLLHNIACFFRTSFTFGRVIDSNNNPLSPANNIRIEVFDRSVSPNRIVAVSRLSADNSGRWEVHALPPSDSGQMWVRAISEDSNFFEHAELNLGYSHGGFGFLNNGTLNFRMSASPPGSITGRVIDQNVNPVAGVVVSAEMIPPVNSGLLIRRGVSLQTDQQGLYTISGLPQGPAGTTYRLYFNLYTRNRLNAGAGDDITSSIAPNRAYGEALRDDANAPSVTNDSPPPATVPQLVPQGPSVAVTSGQATSVGDTTLQGAPGDIAGIVRDQSTNLAITTTPVRILIAVGTPPSFAATVPAIAPGAPVPARTDGGNQSGTDGYYEFCGIPANLGSQQYRVTGLALGFGRGTLTLPVPAGRIMCRASGGLATDTLLLPPLTTPGTVTGTVRRSDDNAGLGNATVTLSFIESPTAAPSVLATTPTNAAGAYTFSGVFATQGTEVFTVTATKANFTTVTSTQFTVAAGQTQTVNVTLDPPGSISGVVRIAGTNAPVGGATITVLDSQGQPLINPDTPGMAFQATTASAVTQDARSNNVQYNYRVRDLPAQSVQIRVSTGGFSDQIRSPIVVPARGENTGQDVLLFPLKIYGQGLQMISHPFNTNGESMTTTLGATPPAFRLARYNTLTNAYEEFGTAAFPSTGSFELGRGYFFLLNQSLLTVTREGTAVGTGTAFALPTFNGWNMIGYPYAPRGDFANGVDWLTTVVRTPSGGDQALSTAAANGIVQTSLYSWNGAGYSLGNRLTPFGGYWVRILQNNVTLLIPNTPLRSSAVLRNSRLSAYRGLVDRAGDGWAFPLFAQTGRARDESALLGASTSARDGYDLRDAESPPPIHLSPFVSVSFNHADWGSRGGKYSTDIRAPVQNEKSWDFEVFSNEPEETVTLSWPTLTANLPRQYTGMLTDLDANQRRYVRTVSHYAFVNRPHQPRRFRLTISSSSEQRLEVQNLLANAVIGGRIQFSFTLSRDAEVSAAILTPSGKTISLPSGPGRAGLNQIVWNGGDARGNRLARGVYVLRLLATDAETGQQVQQIKSVMTR